MPGRAALKIEISENHRKLLEKLVRRQTSSQRLVRRSQIVLAAGAGTSNEAISRDLGVKNDVARRWRGRWPSLGTHLEELKAALALEDLSESRVETLLIQSLEAGFADAPRPGTPVTFTPEQIVSIVKVALEDPAACGRPVSHWTAQEIAEEVVKRKIVARISGRSVGRFLKGGRPQAPPEPTLARTGDRGSRCL